MDYAQLFEQQQSQIGELTLRVKALEDVFLVAKNVNMPNDPTRPKAVIIDGPLALAVAPVAP